MARELCEMIIGVGIDILEIERIANVLQRQAGFLDRLFTQAEKELLKGKSGSRLAEYVAGRFAAKEAAAKAFGTGIGARLRFHDMEILPADNGKPVLNISSHALARLHPECERLRIHMSISHSREYAVAQVILEQM
jgi:holo-[acyl-carrier protein] synthase